MRYRRGFLLWILMASLSLIALIALSERKHWAYDLSEGRRFTLSKDVLEPLKMLSDPMVVRAYLPLSAPPPYRGIARHTKDLLIALDQSHTLVSLEVIDSAQEQSRERLKDLADLAERDGIRTAQLSVERAGRRVLLDVPYGVSFARLNQRVVTPPVEQMEELEYQIARAIKSLMELRPPQRIGLAQGSGEPELLNSPLAKRLEAEGTLVPVRLDAESLEDEVDVLLILGATKSYGERARWVIDRLLCDGGSVIIALDHRQQSELFTDVWSSRSTGLEPLLRRYGISLSSQWVVADSKHAAPAPLSRDARGQITFAPHPLYPIGLATDHPITASFSDLVIPMSPRFDLPPQATPLVLSYPSSVALRSLKSLRIEEAEERQHSPQGFPLAFALEFSLASCLEHPKDQTKASPPSRLLDLNPKELASDGSLSQTGLKEKRPLARLVMIGSGRRLLSAGPKGLELLMNSIAWGRRDGALLSLKRRRVERPRLDLSTSEQTLIQWGTVLVPILIVGILTMLMSSPINRVGRKTDDKQR